MKTRRGGMGIWAAAATVRDARGAVLMLAEHGDARGGAVGEFEGRGWPGMQLARTHGREGAGSGEEGERGRA